MLQSGLSILGDSDVGLYTINFEMAGIISSDMTQLKLFISFALPA
jgi:hypothetical protein